MYNPADFPYYPQYYYHNNPMPKTSFNPPQTHPSAAPSQALASSKPSSRKIKEPTSTLSSSSSSSAASQSMQANEHIDSEVYKQQIIQWLKSMDIEERFEVFLTRDRWFAQTIVKMFWKQKLGGNSQFALYSEEDRLEKTMHHPRAISELEQQFYCRRCLDNDSTSASARAKKKAEQEIISAVRVLDDKEYYNSLAFDKNFLETSIDMLIHAFDVISEFNLFTTSHLSHYNWFNPNKFQSIAAWIVSSFEKILQQKFFDDRIRLNSKAAKVAVTLEKQQLLASLEDTLQSRSNRSSHSENMTHYENLLSFWKSLSAVKRKKVLSTCCEISKALNQSTTNSQGSCNSKNSSNSSNEQEWFCKVRDTFYQTKESSSKNNTTTTTSTITVPNMNTNTILSIYPSDEQLLAAMSSFSDESNSEQFISQLCFPSLDHTTLITTLILKRIHCNLNEMYSEQIVENLIRHQELDRKKRKQQQPQNNNQQPQQYHLIAASSGIAGLAQKKKKKQNHNNGNNQKKNKLIVGSNNSSNATNASTVNNRDEPVTAMPSSKQGGQCSNSNSAVKNTSNCKNNSKQTHVLLIPKEKSFAEEVSLMYEEELKEERRQEGLSRCQEGGGNSSRPKGVETANKLLDNGIQGSSSSKTEGHSKIEDIEILKQASSRLSATICQTAKGIQNSKSNQNSISNTMNDSVTDTMECCDYVQCELAEMSKTIAVKLIQQCITKLDQSDDDDNDRNQHGIHQTHYAQECNNALLSSIKGQKQAMRLDDAGTQAKKGKDQRSNGNGKKNKEDSHEEEEKEEKYIMERDTSSSCSSKNNSKKKKKAKHQKQLNHNNNSNCEKNSDRVLLASVESSLPLSSKLLNQQQQQQQQHNQSLLPSPSSAESSRITPNKQLSEETDDNDAINTATTFDNNNIVPKRAAFHSNQTQEKNQQRQQHVTIDNTDCSVGKHSEACMKETENVVAKDDDDDAHRNCTNHPAGFEINKQGRQLGSTTLKHLTALDKCSNYQERDDQNDEEGFIEVKIKKNNRQQQQTKSSQSLADSKNTHSRQRGKINNNNNNNSGGGSSSTNSNVDKHLTSSRSNGNHKNKQKNLEENNKNNKIANSNGHKRSNEAIRDSTAKVQANQQVSTPVQVVSKGDNKPNKPQANHSTQSNNPSASMVQVNGKSQSVIQAQPSQQKQLSSTTPPAPQFQQQAQQQQLLCDQNLNKQTNHSEDSQQNHYVSQVKDQQNDAQPSSSILNNDSNNTKHEDIQQDTSVLSQPSSSNTSHQVVPPEQFSKSNQSQSTRPNPPVLLPSHIKTKIAKRFFKKKITHDIIQLSEKINTESNYHQPSRHIIFLRIQHVLKKIFLEKKEVDLRIFGSCATGLSLPTSDIDIGITGFERSSKSELIAVLGTLVDALERFSWVKAVERIFTASIPIVKIEIDPSIEFAAMKDPSSSEDHMFLFEESKDEKMEFNLNKPLMHYSSDAVKDNNNLQGMHLKVDISVECQVQTSIQSPYLERFQHIGVLSTDFVTKWMSYYTGIQPMMILMKSFLYARNLNTNYKGGISSYCLLIMIIAFFRDNHALSQTNDYSSILLGFLKFYGSQFNPESMGISLANQKPFFKVIPCPGQSKFQVIEPLMGKVITQNTYLVDEILKEFEGFHMRLTEFSQKCEKYFQKLNTQELQFIDSVSYQELLNIIEQQQPQQQNHPLQSALDDLREFLLPNQIEAAVYEVDQLQHYVFDRAFREHKQQSNYLGNQDFNSFNSSSNNPQRNEQITFKLPNKSRKAKETINNL